MKREELAKYFESPGALGEHELQAIEQLIRAYPFFQSLHLLRAKALHNLQHPAYDKALKFAAIQSPNRRKLFYLINQVPATTAGLSPTINTQSDTDSLPVAEEEVLEENKVAELQQAQIEEPEVIELVATESRVESQELPAEVTNVATSFTEWLKRTKKSEPDQGSSGKKSIIRLDTSEEIKPLMQDAIGELILGNVFNEGYLIKADEPASRNSNGTKDIIEEFISLGHPKVIKVNKDEPVVNLENKARKSADDAGVPVSETLAQIFVKQKLHAKAIATYEKLSLKYPEKKLYFASLIENLKKEIN